jgi:site-specific DNA recombinase
MPMHAPAALGLTGPRCAIYARYSSEQQREASIEDQVRICRARAAREGWQVVEVFADHALSGASALRPGYQAALAALRGGGLDILLAESLDRISRDQEHVAAFYKQAAFAGVRIVTLAEGEVSELHVGLKGTMGALYLKDLADKTRRGLEGRVRQGRSGGGLCYGYRVVRGPAGRDGMPERGLREIDPVQAEVVRRIFREFAEGRSPIAIAKTLNAERVPGPRGRLWSDGALRGHAVRDTGLLRNQLYVGRLVWNRRHWVKDPTTGRRLARANAADALVTEEVPDLRIIDDELWDRVQARLSAQQRTTRRMDGSGDGRQPTHLWHLRRPRHLLTGKILCGCCRTAFGAVGRDYLACKTAVRQGACVNRIRLRRSAVEQQVLDALATRLMQPELVAEFAAEFTAEWNRLAAEASAGAAAKRRELEGVCRKLAGLVEAIADGLRAPGLQARLEELEARRITLEAEVAAATQAPEVPRLHPRIAEIYRERVARLRAALGAGSKPDEVLEAARALIDRVEVHPPAETGGEPWIELVGELSAMLALAGDGSSPGGANAKTPGAGAPGVSLLSRCSESVDAGTGFEPVTFRL